MKVPWLESASRRGEKSMGRERMGLNHVQDLRPLKSNMAIVGHRRCSKEELRRRGKLVTTMLQHDLDPIQRAQSVW
jgi:hypothetical protein